MNAPGPRLLLITAASGTGRHLFARSWLGQSSGQIIDLTTPNTALSQELARINERLLTNPELRTAVILAPSDSVWLLAAKFDCLLARQRDLLLTYAELHPLLGGDEATSTAIYEQTGGWLGAARLLRGSAADTTNAYHLIRNGLQRWLSPHPDAEPIRQAAFLPVMTTHGVQEFYNSLGNIGFAIDDLEDCGIIRANPGNGWSMPHMVRQALIEIQRSSDSTVIHKLEVLGLQTVATTHSVQHAVDRAVGRRSWKALEQLLSERWIDLFISNPRVLRRFMFQVPEFVISQTTNLWAGLRIVTAIGSDRMILPFPSIAPDFTTDRVALRLNEQTAKLSQRPSARAMTSGLLEVTYLRVAGHFKESALATTKLRSVTHTVINNRRISPKLVSVVELHCGISLELQGSDVEAKWAYSAAYQAAEESGTPFQLADATGRLALLCARQNDIRTAEGWLAKHQESISQVAWGQAMVGRGAALTRAWLAVSALDVAELRKVLGELPAETDSDEFWAAHVLLLAFQSVLIGQATEFLRLLNRLAEERVYALSDMSTELIEQSRQLVALAGKLDQPERFAEQRATEFQALAALRSGQVDKAILLLEETKLKPLSQRHTGLHLYLELATRHSQGPSTAEIAEIGRLHASQGRLLDLALLSTIPGWESLPERLELDSESRRRAHSLQQAFPAPLEIPELTERESELLQLLRQGLSRKQMATTTFRSENTIKTQLRGLYRKLNVADGAAALDRARAIGL